MIYSDALMKQIKDHLGLNAVLYTSNELRQLIEDRYDKAQKAVLASLGDSVPENDITISKEIALEYYHIRVIYGTMMHEYITVVDG